MTKLWISIALALTAGVAYYFWGPWWSGFAVWIVYEFVALWSQEVKSIAGMTFRTLSQLATSAGRAMPWIIVVSIIVGAVLVVHFWPWLVGWPWW